MKKFDRNQTSYNKIQHDTTQDNKMAKRVQRFIQRQSCIMLYEMLYSFGRGFNLTFVSYQTPKLALQRHHGEKKQDVSQADFHLVSFELFCYRVTQKSTPVYQARNVEQKKNFQN